MTKRRKRLSPAEREARRVRRELAKNKIAAKTHGKRLVHGLAETYADYGCRCLPCRIAQARASGRPTDPHYPSHQADLHDTG